MLHLRETWDGARVFVLGFWAGATRNPFLFWGFGCVDLKTSTHRMLMPLSSVASLCDKSTVGGLGLVGFRV